jgi:hypothetical protein
MPWPFAWHPELAAACALMFLVGSIVTRRCCARSWPLLVVALLWLSYSAWEYYCTAGQYNIRIDLLVLPTFLLIATIVGCITALVCFPCRP